MSVQTRTMQALAQMQLQRIIRRIELLRRMWGNDAALLVEIDATINLLKKYIEVWEGKEQDGKS